MALTESSMMALGTSAPNFELFDTISKNKLSLVTQCGLNGTLIVFICNHCKYVKHILPSFVDFANQQIQKGINVIAISSNDIETYPEDGPENMEKVAKDLKFEFPYLYDDTQDIAKLYDATCTPDFFLFDNSLKLKYRGRYDNSSPGNGNSISGADLKGACNALLSNQSISEIQFPSMGCNIKWK